MTDKITYQQLIDEFTEKSGRTKAFSDRFIKDIFTSIQEGLRKDENVNIKGLGIFKLQEVAERETLNPKTGRSALIEAHKKIVYRPEKALREKVNAKYADLEAKVIGKKEDIKPADENKSDSESIPTFPKPELKPEPEMKATPVNHKPITSSITNADGSIDIRKIFGGDDLPSDDDVKKENPAFDNTQENDDIEQHIQHVKNNGPQTLDELINITKGSNEEKPVEEEKPGEKVNITFEGDTAPQVFGDNIDEPVKEEEPDLSQNLPWIKSQEEEQEQYQEGAKISPTFIIEKKQRRSPWRWLFPIILVILILAVIYFVPNNSLKIEDIAFWKNWNKITLFERKDKDQQSTTSNDLDKEKEISATLNKDKDKESDNKLNNIFLKLKERGENTAKPKDENEKQVTNITEATQITQAPADEKVLIHIVQPGNTLWGLSDHYYKRSSLWPNIYRKNIEVLPTPDFLPLGRELLIPELNGDSYELSKADSARIAQGYYLAYTAYKKYDEAKAKGYLNMAKKFGTTIK